MTHPLYFSGDDSLLGLVDEVLAELPEEVQRFARKRCWFLVIGRDAGGRCIHGRDVKGKYILVIDASTPDDDWIRDTVRHELAHAVLFNSGFVDHEAADPEWKEDQVEVLLGKWAERVRA